MRSFSLQVGQEHHFPSPPPPRTGPELVVHDGDWRQTMRDTYVDVLLTDPPYTSKVKMGYRSGSDLRAGNPTKKRKYTISYDAITQGDAWDIARWTVTHVRKYAIIFNDHIGWRWIADALTELNWYVFAQVIWHRIGGPPRFQKDGPPDECEYIVVARPRGDKKLRSSIKGFYETKIVNQGAERCRTEGEGIVGQKPTSLIKCLLRDYCIRTDKVADLYGGSGTTVFCCGEMGLDCETSEIDPIHLDIINARMSKGFTNDAFAWLDDAVVLDQQDLFATPANNNAPEGAGAVDNGGPEEPSPDPVVGDLEPGGDVGEDRRRAPGLGEEHHGHQHGPDGSPVPDGDDQAQAEQGAQGGVDDHRHQGEDGAGEAGRGDAVGPLLG